MRTPARTFADYAAIAVCPVLIMVLVGALVFFLLQVGYAGSHTRELEWTLFWFVLAMVLVSRIAIEKGSSYASVFGLALALATAFMLMQYAALSFLVWCLLGLIWWATNKLTWDCTLIDDDTDASGEGLLQAAGLDQQRHRLSGNEAQGAPVTEASADARTPGLRAPARLPRPGAPGAKGSPARKTPSSLRRRSSKPHAPGLWVIYFSLGALPVFGLGQGFIPSEDIAGRRQGFMLLLVYLAATLGLLLITSFLGLRRYLRQRQLEMPPAISGAWVGLGSIIALVILVACILLPRPQATWSLTAMVDRIGDPARKPAQQTGASSKPVSGSRDTETDRRREGADAKTSQVVSQGQSEASGGAGAQDKRGEQLAPAAQAQDQSGRPASPGREKTGAAPQNGETTRPSQDQREGESAREAQQAQAASAAQPSAAQRPALPAAGKLLKALFYLALAVLGLYLAIRNWDSLLGALRELWRALLELWQRSKSVREAEGGNKGAAPASEALVRPFGAFPNPFACGQAKDMSLSELIVYTFNGLEAWAREHRCGRRPEQTPLEFAEQLGEQLPDLAGDVQQLASLYVRVAYAGGSMLPACENLLQTLWIKLTSPAPGLPAP